MKITLIRPGNGSITDGYRLNEGGMEPLALGILAAMLPAGWEAVLYDDRHELIPFDEPTDLVAVSVETFTARRAYEIADRFREQGVLVVLGGIHPTLLPDEANTHADAVVVGDAEPVWAQVLADSRSGKLRRRYYGTPSIPQRGIIPRRDIFRNKGYLPVSLVQFSRGCTYRCSFCVVAKAFGGRHHCRTAREVVEEISSGGMRMVLFTDDNFTANRTAARDLMKEIRPLNVRWACQASVDLATDPELMDLMGESGCIGQLIGFDSLDPASLHEMNKGANLRGFDRYETAIDRLRAHGFQTWASFLLGNDADTPETIRETVEFAIRSKFTLAFFHLLMPYPGTPLYDRLASAERLLYGGKWWLDPGFRYNSAGFIPRHMTPKELAEMTVWANKEFYRLRSIVSRALEWNTNAGSILKLALYARFNLLVRTTST